MTETLCFLFSLVCPGAGQIYAGDFAAGLIISVFFALGKSALLPLAVRAFRVNEPFRALRFFYACNWCYILLIIGAAVGALWRGFYAEGAHFLYAVLFSVCVRLTYKNTFNKFIFTALCGRTGVWELLAKTRKTPTEKK